LLIWHSKYSIHIVKNALIQTTFSAISPTGLYPPKNAKRGGSV